jgi:isorenieratene synthase
MTLSSKGETDTFPVVILGGGLAGLSAGVHLAARGIPPLVLDADRLWPGGRLAGGDPDVIQYQGQTFTFPTEHGMHALWGGYVNMRALLERFTTVQLRPSTGEEWINRWRREVRVVEAGRLVREGWIPAPFHYLSLLFRPRFWTTITPLDFLSLPGFLFSILWTLGLDPIREQVALDGLMMDDYFRGWTPNLRATFTGLGVNLLAAPKEDISLTGMIAAIRFYTMLRRDSWYMHYLPGNPHDCLIQPLIERIRAEGGQMLHGIEAQRLERDGAGWRIRAYGSTLQGARTIYADQVIMALNAPGAQRLLMSSASTQAQATALRFPGVVRNASVRLWFSRLPREGATAGMFTGDFLPDNFFWLHRLYVDFQAWTEATGGSVIELHLYARDSILEQADEVLIIRCVDEVLRAFPELRGSFVQGTIRRNSRVHTAFRVPTQESLQVQTPWEGVYAAGDWIGHDTSSLWMERAVTTGIAAANQILSAHGGEPYPILQPPAPEWGARAVEGLARAIRLTAGWGLLRVARGLRRSTP